VTGGAEHEGPGAVQLGGGICSLPWPRVIKPLILDRGFLDGAKIGRCKKDLGMDVLIPGARTWISYHDVVGMAERRLAVLWVVPAPQPAVRGVPLHRPERIRKREEARHGTLAKKKAAAAQEAKATGRYPVQHLRVK